MRLPQPPAKKRKRGGHAELTSTGTVTGHYLSFLKATMDEMDKYKQMKGHYLVMDNAPIHKSDYISKYIESRGYRCAYLPSYAPELNPIEQFWSVVKSAIARACRKDAVRSTDLLVVPAFLWHQPILHPSISPS